MNSLLSVYFSWWLHKCSIHLLIGCLIYLGGWLCHWPSQQLAVYSQMVAGSAFGPAKIGCQIWHWLVTRIPGYNTFSSPAFDWQPPLTEDNLSIKCKFLYYLKKMTMTIHLDCYARTDCKPEVLSGVETGNRIPHDEWNLRGIAHVYTYTEKTTFLCKDDLCKFLHERTCAMLRTDAALCMRTQKCTRHNTCAQVQKRRHF